MIIFLIHQLKRDNNLNPDQPASKLDYLDPHCLQDSVNMGSEKNNSK